MCKNRGGLGSSGSIIVAAGDFGCPGNEEENVDIEGYTSAIYPLSFSLASV